MVKFISFILSIGLVASCGSPRTVVKVTNKADGSETTISATTGNGGSTSVSVSPSVKVNATLNSPDSLNTITF